jgi:formimidoylglutamate deiminase
MAETRHYCDYALLPSGWVKNVQFTVDERGHFREVKQCARIDAERRVGRIVVPGMPNLHSHAFQRAMAGLAEHAGKSSDTFWTWREAMYRFSAHIEPDDLEAIAAQLYVEMLKAGYTGVCEFHYVHHRPGGKPYADPAAMSRAVLAAARDTGIGMTLLPVLYQRGGMDGRALNERQKRFAHDTDDFLRLIDTLRATQDEQCAVGMALHSLRAVQPAGLREVLAAPQARSGPIHIHIAEQLAEVEECLNVHRARPVAWLLANAAVDARWCLVHATHLTRTERTDLAASGAVAGLCPTTEANLGDGLFSLRPYVDAEGAWGIGSDSHVSVSPVEELRWLEYGQRLTGLRRNVMAWAKAPHTGLNLWRGALAGGAQASGRAVGAMAPGKRADLLVLDHDAPELAGRDINTLLDTAIFSGNRNLVTDVMVGGRWVVRAGRHTHEERIAKRYRATVTRMLRAE